VKELTCCPGTQTGAWHASARRSEAVNLGNSKVFTRTRELQHSPLHHYCTRSQQQATSDLAKQAQGDCSIFRVESNYVFCLLQSMWEVHERFNLLRKDSRDSSFHMIVLAFRLIFTQTHNRGRNYLVPSRWMAMKAETTDGATG